MASANGWNREDLEGLQATPPSMLHPVHPQHDSSPIPIPQDNKTQDWHEPSVPFLPDKAPSPVTVPVGASHDSEARTILGMRKTTFFLTISNMLLAIGLIVLGVVQSQALRNSSGTSTSCPASSTNTTSSAATTNSSEAGKICFATDETTTTAVALGDVISECPLADDKAKYTVPGTNLTFRRMCDTDYPNEDMGQFPVLTMLDCIHLCAQLNLYPASAKGRCLGVSWVYGENPQGTNISYCYPKSSMNTSQKRAGTESAVLVVQ